MSSSFSVSECLSRGSLLSKKLAQYEYRPQQIEMAVGVDKALSANRNLIVEAGTGSGKTLAYLLPAIKRVSEKGKRIVVSTYTINLQEQIVNKDLPLLNSILPLEFTAVLAKGRGNYLCYRRLARATSRMESLFSDAGVDGVLDKLRIWSSRSSDGSLSDIDFHVPSRIWSQVSGEQGNCLGKRCVFFDRCHYWRARRRMQSANIIIANHALLCSDLAARSAGVALLGKYDLTIIDEAHNLENVASEHFGLYLSQSKLNYHFNNLYNPKTGKGMLAYLDSKDAIQAVERAIQSSKAFFDQVREIYQSGPDGHNQYPSPGEIHNNLSDSLKELVEEIKFLRSNTEDEEDRFDLTNYTEKFREIAGQVDELTVQSNEENTYWIEEGRGSESFAQRPMILRAAPITVASHLREALFDRLESVVLTSATLSVGGAHGFDYLAKRWGLDDYESLQIDSPFDFMNQVTMYVEKSLPTPSGSEGFLVSASEAMKMYLEKSEGKAFVLFTSYQMMYKLADMLEEFCDEKGWNMMVQGRGRNNSPNQRFRMLEEFKSSSNAVLFGTDSFWQGVDVVGESLSNVIIVKLPFAVPDKPLVKARIDKINREGGNAFRDFQLPEAILKFKQGFGRLIRSRTDRGIVVVLDNRIVMKSYGQSFLSALPEMKIVVR